MMMAEKMVLYANVDPAMKNIPEVRLSKRPTLGARIAISPTFLKNKNEQGQRLIE